MSFRAKGSGSESTCCIQLSRVLQSGVVLQFFLTSMALTLLKLQIRDLLSGVASYQDQIVHLGQEYHRHEAVFMLGIFEGDTIG